MAPGFTWYNDILLSRWYNLLGNSNYTVVRTFSTTPYNSLRTERKSRNLKSKLWITRTSFIGPLAVWVFESQLYIKIHKIHELTNLTIALNICTQLVDLWLGKGKASLRGRVTSHTRQMCECVITQLLFEQVLVEDYHFTPYSTITYILPGPKQHLLKTDKLDVHLSVVAVRISLYFILFIFCLIFFFQ